MITLAVHATSCLRHLKNLERYSMAAEVKETDVDREASLGLCRLVIVWLDFHSLFLA